jgi:hypothetical protein
MQRYQMTKKILLVLVLICLLSALGVFFAWNMRAPLTARIIHSHLGVPVSIETLDLTRQKATIKNLTIGNPPHFHSPISFTAGLIDIASTIQQIRSNPLIIDEIIMDDLLVNIEKQNSNQTNWNEILSQKTESSKIQRHYLIKSLILRNLNVQITEENGKVKQYPTIDYMAFQNISDETGFPVNEIEKAIFNKMMQNLYQKLDLEKMLQPLIPGGQYLPKGLLPNLFK